MKKSFIFKLIGKNFYLTKVLWIIFLLPIICSSSFGQKTENITVYFKFNKYNLDSNEKSKLDSLIMNKNIQHIILQGHCDSIGSNDYNDNLSMKRVLEVKKYLVSKNLNENIIEFKAHGKRVLLNKNITEQDRALNRRVEIKTTLTIINKKQKEVTISGTVLNEKMQVIKAEISLNDKDGNEIQSISNKADGKYELKALVNKNEEYSLIYYSDSSFISSKNIVFTEQDIPHQDLKVVLPILKGGKKYTLENFNFEGDTSQLINKSAPSLTALVKLMKKNKYLVIRIEGHVNYPSSYGNPKTNFPSKRRFVPQGMNCDQFNQWLSDERAKMVYNYLISKGIEDSRMSFIGFGASKMLYPDAKTESEMEQNRRVEINVISIK